MYLNSGIKFEKGFFNFIISFLIIPNARKGHFVFHVRAYTTLLSELTCLYLDYSNLQRRKYLQVQLLMADKEVRRQSF